VIKILVADDHAVVRQGIKQIIADQADMVVAGEASTGQEVVSQALSGDYDLVLLDITMPGGGGLESLKDLRRGKPDLPVLMLTIHPEDQYARRALKAGASGYLTKDSAPENLVSAIRHVAAGGKYASASLVEALVSDLASGADMPLHQLLSDREFEVMIHIASGKSTKEIAEELFLTRSTVHTYRDRLMKKLGMNNVAELVRYAVVNGLA